MNARPDILWIVTTQWRAQACGYAGDPNARTPQLDALAARSVNYRQAVTPHPFGPLARAALLTGVPSPANGVRNYYDPLPTTARTIAHELAARGYETAFFGKWHLAPRDPEAPLVGEVHARTVVPLERRGGFEVWDGFEGGFLLNDPWMHGHRSEVPERCVGYQSDVVCSRAADWLRSARTAVGSPTASPANVEHERPRFVVVSLEPPHPPYGASAGKFLARDARTVHLAGNVPRGGDSERRAREELAGYYAHIEATDDAIGRHLLPRVTDNTVVVFASVHGDMHGAQGRFRKGWPYEESIRVPLLVRHPGADHPGRLSDAPVSLLDLPRWALAWADRKAAPGNERVECAEISMPTVVALPDQCDRIWRGLRTPTRKLVLNADGSPWMFFHLDTDPLEMKNLVGYPECAAEIAALRPRCRL